MTHPIRSALLHDEVERWTKQILDRTGNGKVTLEFDFRDGVCLGVRIGSEMSRWPLTK